MDKFQPLNANSQNYLFFGSDNGGESAAIIYSLLVTCKLN